MEADFPARPLIGLLLRLVYQHYAQDIDAALRQAGFDDIRPGAASAPAMSSAARTRAITARGLCS